MGSPLITSAQLLVYINGIPYAKVTNYSFSSETGKKPIRGIDSSEAYELAPTTNSVSGSLSILRLLGDDGLEGDGITTQFENQINQKYFSIMVVERRQNTVIFRADHCQVVSQQWDMPARGMVTGSFSFVGIRWQNDASNSFNF